LSELTTPTTVVADLFLALPGPHLNGAPIRADRLLLECFLRWLAALEVSMADFHETSAPKSTAQIDTVGWLFAAFVVSIIAVAAIVAYNRSDTMVAKTTISQVAGPHG
jgi:hypothetical protein